MGLPRKGRDTADEDVEDYSQRPEVTEFVIRTLKDLRGNVERRSMHII